MEAAVRNAGRRFFFLRARRKQRVAPGSGSLKLKTTIAIYSNMSEELKFDPADYSFVVKRRGNAAQALAVGDLLYRSAWAKANRTLAGLF
jgi:hypothetical protein